MTTIQSRGYLTIPGWMRTELDLSGNDLIVYAIIYSACQIDEQHFTGSLQYLADWCGASKQGISKNIRNLIDKGLIEKIECGYNKSEYRCSTKLNTDVQQSLTSNCPYIYKASNNGSNKPIKLIHDTDIQDKKDIKKIRVRNEEINTFKDLYNEHCFNLPRVKKLSNDRIDKIKRIIAQYTLKEIIEVFDKANNSDFLTGNNDRGWIASIDFILREDKFISILEGKYDGKKKQSADGLPVPHKVTKEERENEYIYKF